MNVRCWVYAAMVVALLNLTAMTRLADAVDTGQQAVDPALVGTWRLSSQNQNGAVIFVWVIGNDGHYDLTFQGPHNKRHETGQLSVVDGNWNLQSDAGRTDGGTYRRTIQIRSLWSARQGQGFGSEGETHRRREGRRHKPMGTRQQLRDRLNLNWWELGDGNCPDKTGLSFSPGRSKRMGNIGLSSQGAGAAVQDTGQVTFAQGSWSKHSDSGKTNQRTYNLIDQDTLSVTGSAARTAKWLRLVNAAPLVAAPAAPPVAAAQPPISPTAPAVASAPTPSTPKAPPANNPPASPTLTQNAAPPAQSDEASPQGSVTGGDSSAVASNVSSNSQNPNPAGQVAAPQSGKQVVDPAVVGTWHW